MQVRDMKQKSVDVHDFAMIPKAEIPRSSFRMEKSLKTTHNFSILVPILVEEVLPGDSWNCKTTLVARTATPIVPIMDNWHLEMFAFFVPNRWCGKTGSGSWENRTHLATASATQSRR